MLIKLKNGEELKLEVSSLILEYVEEYDGGLEQLLKDAKGEKNEQGYTKTMYAANHLIYCIVASNYDKELTYRQAIRLVKFEDIDNIVKFVKEELVKLEKKEGLKTSDKLVNLHRI